MVCCSSLNDFFYSENDLKDCVFYHYTLDGKSIKKTAKEGFENLLSANPNIADVLLGEKNVQVVNFDILVEEVQKRVWGALKNAFHYSDVVNDSDDFLRNNVFTSISMVVMYVDLVGSTQMVLDLPQKQLAAIISSFAQEMAYVIKQHNGYVLKFVGDAVIGYFVEKEQIRVADSAVSCAESMIKVIEMGINPILKQYDYPDLKIKIGIDCGENTIIRYGHDEKESHVDLLGQSMNMAAKIQGRAHSDQILIGGDVYAKLHPSIQEYFEKILWKNNEWNYQNKITGKIYDVYAYIGK